MIKQTYKPIEPVNIGVNKDTINDFARKYNLEIERVYDILNKYKQRKVAFTAKGDYWNVTETGATLSVAHNGNIIYAVFSVTNGVETQVVVGVKRDDTNVILEAEAPFGGYMLFLSDDSTRGVGDNLENDILQAAKDVKGAADKIAKDGYSVAFKTVAEMKSTNIPEGVVVKTAGYYSANDGGGATYIIKSTTEKFAEILTNGLKAELCLVEHISSKCFGVIDTNNNIDFAAIGNLITNGVVSEINIPTGTFVAINSLDIITDKPMYLIGKGIQNTIIVYEGNSPLIKYTKQTAAWDNCLVRIEGVHLLNRSSVAGNVILNNACNAVIKNCKFSLPSAVNKDIDNIQLLAQTHYATIENCFIYGGNGIVNNASNGLKIINNYITYCNKGINLKGSHCIVKGNDLEGYNKYPYVLNCANCEIYCFGERNIDGKWVEIDGNSNKITISMYSAGGTAYNPLLSINGDYNDITILGCTGYKLVENISGIGNNISVKGIKTLTNYSVLTSAMVSQDANINVINDDNIPLVFDIATDDLTPYIVSGDYTYDSTNKQITMSSATKLNFNFSALTGGKPYFLYMQGVGVSNPGHFYPIIKSNGDSGTETGAKETVLNIVHPTTTNIYNAYNNNGISYKFTKLRIALGFTNKLWK